MKQCQLIGYTAVLAALVTSPSPASAQISEERIRELVREAAKTAEQTGPSPVLVPGQGPTIAMTLDDAVRFALERNLDIAVQRLNPQLQDIAVATARTFYGPTLTSRHTGRASNVLDERSEAGASMRSRRNQTTGDPFRCVGSICT